MITLVTGTLGSGKSLYAVRNMADALARGRCVATNIQLRPDFAEQIARRMYMSRIIRGGYRGLEDRIQRSYFYSDDLDELSRVKLAGTKEGRGLMCLDEGHGWLNSRNWSDADRMGNVRFFTQARKLGWHLDLLTQDDGNIDKQVRVLFEYKVRLRNLQKMKVAGIPISPVKLFMAIRTWNGAGNAVVGRDFFKLNWTANLYDTHEVHHGLADQMAQPSVVLPRPVPDALAAASVAVFDPRPPYEVQAQEALQRSLPLPSVPVAVGHDVQPHHRVPIVDFREPERESLTTANQVEQTPRSGAGLVTPVSVPLGEPSASDDHGRLEP